MAIAQRGTTTTGAATSSAALVVNTPTGVQSGDMLVAIIVTNNQAVTSTGWTSLAAVQASTGNNWRSTVLYKVAGGSEPANYTFNVSASGAPMVGSISAFSGVDNVAAPAHNDTASGSLTEPHTGPTATNTATAGRTLYYRSSRVAGATGAGDVPSYSTAVGTVTELTDTGVYSGGTVCYSHALYADNADFSSGGNKTGLAITATTATEESDNVEGTIVLKAAPAGSTGQTLPSVTSSLAGNSAAFDATISMTLSPVSFDGSGTHFPVGTGAIQTVLPSLNSGSGGASFSGTSATGGTLDGATLSPVTADMAGSVNPIGSLSGSLSPVSVSFSVETRMFGEQVIVIEQEKRAFKVTDDGLISIYASGVSVPRVGVIDLQLPSVTSLVMGSGADISGDFSSVALPSVTSLFSGAEIGGDFDSVTLPSVTALFVGSEVSGDFDSVTLPSVTSSLAGSVADIAGDFDSMTLPSVTSLLAGTVADISGDFNSVTLPSVTSLFAGSEFEVTGDFSGVTLPSLTSSCSATVEDLMKFTTPIGNGSATSYSVTHNANSRAVVVSVYDSSTYEEVIPATVVHTDLNNVTVTFSSAPATNEFTVVVIWSSV